MSADGESVQALRTLLAERLGLESQSLGTSVLQSVYERRRRVCGLATLAAYAARVAADAEELEALTEELMVPETWFFRDRRPFEELTAEARARRAAGRSPRWRTLSVPCATGEEAYSIAIALLEAGVPATDIKVLGIDVSHRSIARAREAVYAERSFKGVPEEVRRTYFEKCPDGYRPIERVRSLVRFEQGNLLDLGRQVERGGHEAVFCRNMLIYLTSPARERVLSAVDASMVPGGLLALGHAESPSGPVAGYEPVRDSAGFVYRKPSLGMPAALPAKLPALPEPAAWLARPRVEPASTTRLIVDAKPAPPPEPRPAPGSSPPVNAEPPVDRLTQARALANRRDNAGALRACQEAIAHDGATAAAYHLMGMIHQSVGSYAEAESSLTRAVYLDPGDEEALLSLALLARRRGDTAAAQRFTRLAERARTNRGDS